MTDTAERTKQILVAGIGNAWMRDDGFGGEVAKLLGERELPRGVNVVDQDNCWSSTWAKTRTVTG